MKNGSPFCAIDRTFQIEFPLQLVNRKTANRRSSTPVAYNNPVNLARAWRKRIDDGEFNTAADLARGLGVSRARVTQVLGVLKLTPSVLRTIASLGDPLPYRTISEHRLRPLIAASPVQQAQAVRRMITPTEMGKTKATAIGTGLGM